MVILIRSVLLQYLSFVISPVNDRSPLFQEAERCLARQRSFAESAGGQAPQGYLGTGITTELQGSRDRMPRFLLGILYSL
jgi:hypothetical protein